jgi:serine/threonine-protein kinase HipA
MRRTIRVLLGEEQRLIGTVRYDQEGARESTAFEYDGAWLAASDRFAIDPTLPLVVGAQFHRKTRDGSAFHPAIADTEPDGWGRRVILRDHARRRQEARRAGAEADSRPLNALDFLLAVDDFSRVGALRLQDEDGVCRCAPEDGRRSAPPLIELAHLLAATRAVETNSETAADLAYLRGRATSLGGLRPKCTVIDDAGRMSIGKFPSVGDERAVTKGEVLAMRLATAAGIAAAEAMLVDSDGTPVALIRRFDRPAGGGRRMYVSAAAMLGVDPSNPGESAYTEIVDALRIHGASTQADIEELWRRMAFSILITNVDDHLRNHGFLHVERGQWRLAPAFDLNPFPDRVRELKTWISEEAGPEATVDALMSVIPYFRIAPARAKAILHDVERAVAGWRDEGRAIGMVAAELDQFADAFEHAERGAARRAMA